MKKFLFVTLSLILAGCASAPQGLKTASPAACGMDPARLALADSAINSWIDRKLQEQREETKSFT